MTTDGRLNDRKILAPLGVRFADQILASEMASLVAVFGAEVSMGLPAQAGEVLRLQATRSGNRFAAAFKTLRRLLPVFPHGRVKAQIELEVATDPAEAGAAPPA